MRLQPVRFVGHRIGPFENIELNWEKGSENTIIIGENGTGKSTLVAALAACFSHSPSQAKNAGKTFAQYCWDEHSSAFLEATLNNQPIIAFATPEGSLSVEDIQSYRARFKGNEDLTFFSTSRSSGTCSRTLKTITDAWEKNKDVQILVAAYGVGRNLAYQSIEAFKEIRTNPFLNVLDPQSPIASTDIFQWIANQQIRHALAIVAGEQAEAQEYLNSIERIQQLMSEGLDFPVSFKLERNPVELVAHQNNSKQSVSINQLSDGTKSFLSWTLDYLYRASRINWKYNKDASTMPGVIIVDEIDSHLHPEWQRRIMPSMTKVLPNTCIIATTHSPFILGSADNTQLFRIKKGDNGKLTVESSFDKYHGYSADLVLLNEFVDSLYPPEIEKKMKQLSELEGKITFGNATNDEKQKHIQLLEELSAVNPWLRTLLSSRKQHG